MLRIAEINTDTPINLLAFNEPPIAPYELVYEENGVKLKIKPIGIYAWKLFLGILIFGEKESEGFYRNKYHEEELRAFVGVEEDLLKDLLLEVGRCCYEIERIYYIGRRKRIDWTVKTFIIAWKWWHKKGVLFLSFPSAFEPLRQAKHYLVFAHVLHSSIALNLHAFLTINNTLSEVKEEALLHTARVGFLNNREREREVLRQALDELVKVGFLKGWTEKMENGEKVFTFYRPEDQELRAKAQEILQEIEPKVQWWRGQTSCQTSC